MNFAEKYEILEVLTSGRVSTFRARERTTQEQVLVHSFECIGTDPPPSSTGSILMRFASLAPNAPGVVLKAGFEEESSSAYLVTRMPDPASLQRWIRAYRSNSKAGGEICDPGPEVTAEISASEVERALAQRGRAKTEQPVAARESGGDIKKPFSTPSVTGAPRSGGDFTRLFQELGAFQPLSGQASQISKAEPLVKPLPPDPFATLSTGTDAVSAPADAAVTPGSEAGPFARQFFSEATNKFDGPTLGRNATLPTPLVAKEPRAFTRQFFFGEEADSSGSAQGSNSPPSTLSGPKEPGIFTREFLVGADPAHQDATMVPGSGSPEGRPAQKSPSPSGSTMFGGMFDSDSSEGRSATGKDRNSDPSKTGGGEFTSFFRGPFDQPGPSNKPIVLPDASDVRTPRQQTGDFTRMFGNERDPHPDDPRMSPLETDHQNAPRSFTDILIGDSKSGAKLGTSRLGTSPPLSDSFDPITEPAAKQPDRAAASPVRPSSVPAPEATEVHASTSESTFLNRGGRSDATKVFRSPGSEGPPEAQEVSSGPSEFTQFLSRGRGSAAPAPEPAVTPFAQNLGGVFPTPAVPQPPPLPFAPPAPPPVPAVAPPAVPKPVFPAPPAPVAGPASYWPLITVFTILVAIGALLVMYFALRH